MLSINLIALYLISIVVSFEQSNNSYLIVDRSMNDGDPDTDQEMSNTDDMADPRLQSYGHPYTVPNTPYLTGSQPQRKS